MFFSPVELSSHVQVLSPAVSYSAALSCDTWPGVSCSMWTVVQIDNSVHVTNITSTGLEPVLLKDHYKET